LILDYGVSGKNRVDFASGNNDSYSVRSFAFAAAVVCPIHVTNETNVKVECALGDQGGCVLGPVG
jgi:hypothetical protein